MFNLILKDIILFKKTLAFSFAYVIFFIIIIFKQENFPTSLATLSILLVSTFTPILFMIGTSIVYEDKFKTDRFFNSLPVNKENIVLSKYLSAFLYFIIGIVFYIASLFIFKLFNFNIAIRINLLSLSFSLLLSSIYIGINLPLYYLLGYNGTRIFNFVYFIFIYFLSKELSKFFKRLNLSSTIFSYIQKLNHVQLSLILFSFSLFIITISLFISVKLYMNKDI